MADRVTDNDIKKALERCGYHSECCYCNSLEECGSKRVLVINALDLINRQQAEIERLKVERDKEHDYCNHYIRMCAKAKSEAIKEFWNKLKSQNTMDRRIISVESGDTLVKEMSEVKENRTV